jgi:K+-sensing histidine kinase KdpD
VAVLTQPASSEEEPMRRAWIESLTHDLRTPLTVLMAEAYLLRRHVDRLGDASDPEARRALCASAEAIEAAAERLARDVKRHANAVEPR